MKQFFKAVCIPAIIAATPLSSSAVDLGENIFANVNGENLNYAMVNLIVGNNQVPPDQLDQVLDRLISQMVMAQAAQKDGIADDELIKAELELGRIQVLARTYLIDFLEKNPVNEEEINARHEEVLKQYEGQNEYHAYHILLAEEAEAKMAMEEIDGDKDAFQAKAREVSIDTGSGANGGDLSWSIAAAYVPEFSEAISSMEPGEFSNPIQTQFGWHLIYLEETRDFSAPPFNEAQRQQIVEAIQSEKVNKEIERLNASAQIVRDDE